MTHERISSFCYWCGRLGHTYKDCNNFYEREDNETVVLEKNMPYGEWMKASPMKHVQVSPVTEAEEKERVRKSLFQNKDTKSEEIGTKAKSTKQHEAVANEVEEVSELLKSLGTVVVDDKQRGDNIDRGKVVCDSQTYNTVGQVEKKLEKKEAQGNISISVRARKIQ